MEILSDPTPDMLAMPRFDDGAIDMQELLRRLAEQVVNAVMDAEADQLCGGGANSRNGYRERSLATCVGTLTLRIPKLRSGSFFPEDVLERHRRVDRALVAAVAEMYATGTSTRKVQRVAEKMGVSRLSKDQVSAIASSLDADIEDLCVLIGMLHAFSALGVPATVLTDNMKSVVVRRDADGRPVWQADYAEFMGVVGFRTRLCRPRHPYTKGKVERLVRFVKGNFLAGRSFTDLDALNREAALWCAEQGGRWRRPAACVPMREHDVDVH